MSEANAELVHAIFAPWQRGDFTSAEWAHPEIEFVWADGPDPGAWTGVPAMAPALREMLSPWEHARSEVDACRELDGERVLVLLKRSGRGKRSGLDLEAEGAVVFYFRAGKVIKLVVSWQRDRALADLGMRD